MYACENAVQTIRHGNDLYICQSSQKITGDFLIIIYELYIDWCIKATFMSKLWIFMPFIKLLLLLFGAWITIKHCKHNLLALFDLIDENLLWSHLKWPVIFYVPDLDPKPKKSWYIKSFLTIK